MEELTTEAENELNGFVKTKRLLTLAILNSVLFKKKLIKQPNLYKKHLHKKHRNHLTSQTNRNSHRWPS